MIALTWGVLLNVYPLTKAFSLTWSAMKIIKILPLLKSQIKCVNVGIVFEKILSTSSKGLGKLCPLCKKSF